MVHGFGLVIGPLIGGVGVGRVRTPAAFYVVLIFAGWDCNRIRVLPETFIRVRAVYGRRFLWFCRMKTTTEMRTTPANSNGNTMPSFLKFLNLKNMTKRDKKSNLGKLLKDPDQRLLLTCAAAIRFGFVAKLTVIPLFASGQLHATSLQVGELFS